MPTTVQITTLEGYSGGWQLENLPDQCPICHAHMSPRVFNGVTNDGSNPNWTEVIMQCTRHECQRLFIAHYLPTATGRARFRFATPVTPSKPLVPDSIATMSPSFCDIYSQALAAEQDFPQLTGMGLRRALEFLIKDYVRNDLPRFLSTTDSTFAALDAQAQSERLAAETAKVLKANISAVINTYIDNAQVRFAASRAIWLGNDETHYVRLWDSHDIQDLKTLIRLTINFLDSVLLTRQYEVDMAHPRK